MKDSIMDVLYVHQLNDGELSEQIDSKEEAQASKLWDEIKQKVDKDTLKLFIDYNNLRLGIESYYFERHYKQGFKDCAKVLNEIKAIN